MPPYPEEHGGAVLSTTIGKYAYCTLIGRKDDSINVRSLDYDIVASYNVNGELRSDGKLDLVKAAIRGMNVKNGFDLFLHTDAPPGSGLGTSSALVVAIVGAFKQFLKLPLTSYDIAELAYHIERDEAGIKGGRQDHYAATFGGFNFIEFLGKTTIVNPLRISWDTINELEYRLMLCYTGGTRLSAGILDDQVAAYIKGTEDVVQALEETRALAFSMKNALLLGKLNEFGSLLHQAWCCKKRLSKKMLLNRPRKRPMPQLPEGPISWGQIRRAAYAPAGTRTNLGVVLQVASPAPGPGGTLISSEVPSR